MALALVGASRWLALAVIMKLYGIVTLVYGALVLLGGIMGYVQAKSVPSLISGVIFGVALLAAGFAILQGSAASIYVALVLALLLALFFGIRFYGTGKWMPAGLMLLLSALTFMVLLSGLRR